MQWRTGPLRKLQHFDQTRRIPRGSIAANMNEYRSMPCSGDLENQLQFLPIDGLVHIIK